MRFQIIYIYREREREREREGERASDREREVNREGKERDWLFNNLRLKNNQATNQISIPFQRVLSLRNSCLVYSMYYTMLVIVKGARGIMVIVVGNGYGDTSSNPGGY